jgi:ribose-phosphate pyrophosphokinase
MLNVVSSKTRGEASMAAKNGSIKLVAGNSNPALAQDIASGLGLALTKAVVRRFADMEIFVEIQENVRGSDAFIIQSTSFPANDHLMELLIITDALRRSSARRITAVIPYFGYARQDRRSGSRTPISAKLVANLITVAGADRALTMDLHSAQIQGFFDIPVDHLYASPVINEHIRGLNIPMRDFVVLCPDEGSIKRALTHQKKLGGAITIVDKRRSSATETKQANLIGASLEGKVAVIFDDMISTGSSVVGAARVAMKSGAREVIACATHAVLCGPSINNLREAPLKEIVLTDSIPLSPEKYLPNMKVLMRVVVAMRLGVPA